MLLRSAVTLALFFTVTGCSRAPEPVVAKPAETAAANPPVPAAAPPPAPTEEPPVPAAQFGPSMAWQVRTVPNPDDGTEVVVGALDAQDTIATRTAPQKPSLLLRCIGGKPDIVIATHAMAQTVPDGNLRVVRFRFRNDFTGGRGSKAERVLAARESQDHESFLFTNVGGEFAKLATTETLHVAFTRLRGEDAAFSFRLGGYEEARSALKARCPSIP